MRNEELKHHGVPGMKWGIRRQRDSNGNLTRYGANRLASKLNKSTNSNSHMAVKYKWIDGSNAHVVYQRTPKEQEDYKKRLIKGSQRGSFAGLLAGTVAGPLVGPGMWIPAVFGGSLLGATISSKKYEIEKGKEFTQQLLNEKIKTTTIIGDDDSLVKYINKK